MTDHQCARCGSSVGWIDCEQCDEGYHDLYEQDPLWYDEGDVEACDFCVGRAGWWACISTSEWCEANPLPGREDVKRGEIETFEVSA